MSDLRCAGCGKRPKETHGVYAVEAGMTPEQYVRREEGTLYEPTGMYLCDLCYIRNGSPSGHWPDTPRWTASPENLEGLGIIW